MKVGSGSEIGVTNITKNMDSHSLYRYNIQIICSLLVIFGIFARTYSVSTVLAQQLQ